MVGLCRFASVFAVAIGCDGCVLLLVVVVLVMVFIKLFFFIVGIV